MSVTSLHTGAAILAPGEVCAETVAEIEKLLEMARSGEVQGFATVFLHSDGAVGCTYSGPVKYAMIGRLVQLTNNLAVSASNTGR